MSGRHRIAALLAATLSLAACTGGGDEATPAETTTSSHRDGPDWVVAVGDSYISGEGARWAANTNGQPDQVDALGPRAYADQGRREADPGCHRARVSEVELGAGLRAKTLACSGATTASTGTGREFKPGLDFADDGSGRVGQAAALQNFADSHQVSAVVVSIGGNDFGFGQVVAQCAGDFFATVGRPREQHCRDDSRVQSMFTAEHRDLVAHRITTAIRNVANAMRRAGYQPTEYQLVVQTYPSPIPPGPRIRYRETLLERGLVGGCPFFSTDATWANTALDTINSAVREGARASGQDNVELLDLTNALDGHRLCERGVGLFDARRFGNWRADGVAASVEWVNRVYAGARPWQTQESLHPNYWGVLATRSELAALLSE